MAIIAAMNDINMLEDLERVVDAVCVPTPFSSYTDVRFNLNDLDIIVNKANKPLYLLVNGLYEDKDMKGVYGLINKYKNKVNYIFGDLGVLNILMEFNLVNHSIYNPNTLICNSLDANEYLNFGLKAVGLGQEITVLDMEKIINKTNHKTLVKVFGYHPMFTSKRELITTYLEHINDNNKVRKGYLVEELRPDKLPIIEDIDGTTIYRHYPINLIKEIDKVSQSNYLFFDPIFVDTKTYIRTIEIYKNTISGLLTKDEATKLILEIFPYNDGFIYKDTVYEERDF